MNDKRRRREPVTIQTILKPLERANREMWLRLLERVWPNVPLERRLDPREVRRALFLRYDNIGDMITTLPTIRLMKRLNPAMEIDVIASPANRRIIESDPNVTRIHQLRNRPDLFMRDIRAARAVGYDLIVCCIFAKSSKVGIIANLIGGAHAVKTTVWRAEKYWRYFNIQSKSAAAQASMWDKMLHLVPATFDYELKPGDDEPYIAIDDRSRSAADVALTQLGMPAGGFVAINITSARERNRWTLEGFTAVTRAILDASERNRVLILSMGEDRAIAEQIIAALPDQQRTRVASYPPTRDVMEIVAVVDRSEAVFSLDTGVIHMASATGRPALGLYVGGQAAEEWRPYGVLYRIVQTSGKDEPVAAIPPEPVVAAMLELLGEARGRGSRKK